MAVIAIKKSRSPTKYKNKAEAIKAIEAAGHNTKNYEFLYVYQTMRPNYSSGYKRKHREAALRYYHKNKVLKKEL